ncbi:hypothetical protein [Haliscomenobacter sp.]|uniref:hypothetical protein n=1 Tax=Haliscomenobacter sp. TaxID=2717303 RepID=UPI003364FCA8
MNQRIKELALTCGGWNQVYGDQKFMTKETFNVEKFAELIVKDCAHMAESFHHHQYDFTGNLELHECIKEHFGVEP